MASLRDYYRRMAEENARLQEELRQARAEQSDSADNYKDIPEDTPIPEPTSDLTVNDTLQISTQEEDDEFQKILDYYIDGIKKGYISNNDIPLKYRDKIVE